MQFHLFYGEGKGKTTAALGQALRSWGWGQRVLFVQFLKDAAASSGEVAAVSDMRKRWHILRSPLSGPVLTSPGKGERAALKRDTDRLYERALGEVGTGKYDVVVLDEALAAWKLGFLRVKDVRVFRREAELSEVKLLVATGRWLPVSLTREADLVTEMRQVKHPFQSGGKARKGIEF